MLPSHGVSSKLSPVATTCPNGRPPVPPSSPSMNSRPAYPLPDAALKNAETGGRSAEHSRFRRVGPVSLLDTSQSPAPALSVGFQVCTLRIRSSPLSTVRSDVRTVHLETNAPRAPWARTSPCELPSSWFIRTVKVPSPLANAPRPSGIPTIRYGVIPSGLVFTESPTVRIDRVTTPDAAGNRYGDCELLGPVSVPGAAPATDTVAATTATTARLNNLFLFMVSLSLPRADLSQLAEANSARKTTSEQARTARLNSSTSNVPVDRRMWLQCRPDQAPVAATGRDGLGAARVRCRRRSVEPAPAAPGAAARSGPAWCRAPRRRGPAPGPGRCRPTPPGSSHRDRRQAAGAARPRPGGRSGRSPAGGRRRRAGRRPAAGRPRRRHGRCAAPRGSRRWRR